MLIHSSTSNFCSADSYMPEKCKGKQWKAILKEWLNLLKLMRNARSLYQSKVLHEVLTKRLANEFIYLLLKPGGELSCFV